MSLFKIALILLKVNEFQVFKKMLKLSTTEKNEEAVDFIS